MKELLERVLQGDESAWEELRGMGERLIPAIPELRTWLRSEHPQVQTMAAELLETLRGEAAPAVPELTEALRTGSPPVRAAAADTLAAIGGPALQALCGCLTAPEADARRTSCRALGALGPVAAGLVPTLLERAEDTDETEEVRLRAVWAIGRIGTDQAVEGLARVYESEGGTLALWIAEALGSIGRAARPAAVALRDGLTNEDADVALASAGALLELRMYEDQAVAALIRWLQHSDTDIAAESALLLGEIGGSAIEAIPALMAVADSDDEFLRRNAQLAIAKIRPEYARA